jgi:hypothetical protein
MEANLKKVVGDLNRSRGVAESSCLTDATANPIAKVRDTCCYSRQRLLRSAICVSIVAVDHSSSVSQLRGCLDHPVVFSSCFFA